MKAETKPTTPSAPDLVVGELHISLYPRQSDTWSGTAAQLTDAGLIPKDYKWPMRTEWRKFTHNGFECSLQRKRGARGQAWAGNDSWRLTRYCASRGNGGAMLFEKEQAFRDAIWRRSPAGKEMFNRFWAAHKDERFQAFKLLALGMSDGGAA